MFDIEYPDAYYHVKNRGNRREDIFLTDKDRVVFLDGLADNCETYSIKLITYVLMSNQFHLLVQTPYLNYDSNASNHRIVILFSLGIQTPKWILQDTTYMFVLIIL